MAERSGRGHSGRSRPPYARYRPGYPAAAFDWALAPAPGGEVLDLGAGTGKVTEALLRRPGVRVTAVDPDPAMLAQFRADFPTVDAHEGTAERIPLPAAAVDAVVVGTAWHWFDRALAEPEIAPGAAARRRARRALERRRRHRRVGARLPARAAPAMRPTPIGTTTRRRPAARPGVRGVRDAAVRQPGAHHDRRVRRDHRHALVGPDRRSARARRRRSPGCATTWRRGPRRRRARSRCPWSPTSCARCAGRPAAARAGSGRARAR